MGEFNKLSIIIFVNVNYQDISFNNNHFLIVKSSFHPNKKNEDFLRNSQESNSTD